MTVNRSKFSSLIFRKLYILLISICIGGCFSKGQKIPKGMVLITGNERLNSFLMDQTEITNKEFQAFIMETKYVTTAEKAFNLKFQKGDVLIDSLVEAGSLVFKPTNGPVPLDDFSQWWEWVPGAYWAAPDGPGSSIDNRMNHPVVHISYEDALAYANWLGKRLPTENEWQYAAKGGEKNDFPWGNESAETAHDKANFWQGLFPYENNLKDGFLGSAPVKTFEPNAYGLYDMGGNVWEWCISNTKAPVVKGGSFLCNDSYCSGYLISSRMPNDRESSLNHTGFRLVKDIE